MWMMRQAGRYLVRAYAWKIILGQEGILNGFLKAIGVIHE